MHWHIELKLCIWLWFHYNQIKFECRHFSSFYLKPTPFLSKNIEIHASLFSYILWHSELKFFNWLCFYEVWMWSLHGVHYIFLSCSSNVRVVVFGYVYKWLPLLLCYLTPVFPTDTFLRTIIKQNHIGSLFLVLMAIPIDILYKKSLSITKQGQQFRW